VEKGKTMRSMKMLPMTLGLAMLAGLIISPVAKADEWDKKTTVTFSGPVEIPGVHIAGWGVLPAGTYVFKILDSQSDRHIVQIFNKEENICYATILAIPNFRLKATDKTVMTFRERAAGEPEALRAWFYPGSQWGEEFVYPKAKAMEIATATSTPVLFSPVELPVEVSVPIVADAPFVAQMRVVPVRAYQPTGAEVELAEVVTPPPPAQMQAAAVALPTTAGSMPLIALFGLLTLAGALSVRFFRQKML
jgi:hypothetical protein